MVWLHRYLKLLVASTLVLVAAGGMVTSTGSGLAVPDWPTSYGYFMFSFPLSYMVGGIFYEHGHRLIASTVGLLTVVLVIVQYWKEPRRWARRLGAAALLAVVVQGTLGGITVLYFLPDPVSIAHAGLAQIFLCLTISLALFTSRGWLRGYGSDAAGPAAGAVDDSLLRRLAIATTTLIYIQILIGATMRHTDAGLAIPDFPLAFGRLVPPAWSPAVAVHFAHRVGAAVALCAILAVGGHVWRHHRARRELTRPAGLLMFLVLVQFTLGGFVIWTGKNPLVNTGHVATGALVLGTSLVLALRAHRALFRSAVPASAALRPSPMLEPRSSVGARA